jgi:long-chain acyl-CoA synthetase
MRRRSGAAVQTANGALSRVEQTKQFAILPVSWEPGGDQVTPTIKLKRQAIAAIYAQRHRVPVRRSLRGGASRRS